MVAPLRRLTFFQTPKKVSKKGLPLRPAPRLGSGCLRSGIHPWVIASGWLRWHLLSMTAAAPQRAARSPRMNTSTQPPEGAGESRSKARSQARSRAAGELTLGLLSGWVYPVIGVFIFFQYCTRMTKNTESAATHHMIGFTVFALPISNLSSTKTMKPRAMPRVMEYVSGISRITKNAGIASS